MLILKFYGQSSDVAYSCAFHADTYSNIITFVNALRVEEFNRCLSDFYFLEEETC